MAIKDKLLKQLAGLARDRAESGGSESIKTFSEKMDFEEFILYVSEHHDVEDAEGLDSFLTKNVVDNRTMRANHTQSPVSMVRRASTNNGFMLTLENGQEVWSLQESVPGDIACTFQFKVGHVRKYWNPTTQEVDGYSVCINPGTRLITVQQMDRVSFEAAVRNLTGAVAAPATESGAGSLF